ncbi:MAG TPA: Hpt domain-containing protein [Candidatus Polarisedimenticolaceae bacterium]
MDLRRYLDLFVAESREHLARAAQLAAAMGTAQDERALRESFRHLHSLKGMAATMGFASMRDLAHAAEGVLDACRRGALDPSRGGALVGEATACLERLVDRAARGESPDDDDGALLAARLRAFVPAATPADPGGSAAPVPSEGGKGTLRLYRVGMRLDRERPFPALRAAAVLGRLGRLGRVVASTPPAARLRTGRCDGTIAATLETTLEGAALGAALARIDELESFTVAPTEAPAVQAPAPPTAFARLPIAAIDDWLADANELVRALTRAGADPRALALARRLRRRSLDARLIPFEPLAGRVERAAGDLARGLGKEVAVTIEGRDTQIDRVLFDAIADPLLHLVRNAVDHGLEPPAEREALGKPRRGLLRVTLVRRAASLDVAFEDDGRGVDLEAVRREASTRGLLTETQIEGLDARRTLALLLEPGFSTARRAGVVSGRGVGLDVVAEAVRTLGGRLDLEARPGRGLRVRMNFPFATARLHAVVVRAGVARLAIPASAVVRARPAGDAPIEPLASRLGGRGGPPPTIAIELRRTAGALTLGVDAVDGRYELVVRALRGPLTACGAYGAAGVLDDGTPVLVIDPEAL